MTLAKLVSGGQTGADRAALDVALRYGFPSGGWCPGGRRAEDGPIGPRYSLKETPSQRYLQRTEWNVRDSEGTVVFTFAARLVGGSKATVAFARLLGRPCLHLSRAVHQAPAGQLREFVRAHRIGVLNVAGSPESNEPGIHAWATGMLEEAFF